MDDLRCRVVLHLFSSVLSSSVGARLARDGDLKVATGPPPACGLSRASLAPTEYYFGYIKSYIDAIGR
ncbi:hypothetical protein PUP68_02225 [Pseudomonas chlororaphis]|uniref:hypothetical protein n=1 Tax=Pseudomonas chlororaphis TaxID=587753 RepID=UPI0023678E48|nr:hypothetical protein [Pseudomonas chlororaphis]WDG81012.1 hypothetical protein PUP77_10015 [Pseudomonas chlororaphis]WDG85935.1 hypothetical protein PUP68_02225 [Pseudomonas chlororaphis]